MKTTLTNDFHGTTVTLRPSRDGIVSPRAWKRAQKILCGIDGCTCGVVRGPQPDDGTSIQYATGPEGDYLIVEEAR